MASQSIENLVNRGDNSVSYKELYELLNQKLKELYSEKRAIPLLDYADIRYSAMIDLIYEMMPSLRDEMALKEYNNEMEKTLLI